MSFSFRAVFLLSATLLLTACGASDTATLPSAPSHQVLQKILDDGWAGLAKGRTDYRGSMVLHIESAAGNYTLSSGDPVSDPENVNVRVASNTKNFTAAAIMLLAQEGRLNLDDRLGDVIPGTQTPYLPASADFMLPHRDSITIRQLLAHRGGVFDLSNANVPAGLNQPYAGQSYTRYVLNQPGNETHTFTFAELAGVVSVNQLSQFAPGQQFKYSNGGYSLLAKIVEQVSGMRYDQFLQQRFFAPLAMTHTRAPYLGTDQNLEAPFLRGFAYAPPPDGLIDVTETNPSVLVGAGNMISNAHELAVWYRALFTGGAGLNTDSLGRMMALQPTQETLRFYGLGVTYTPGLGYGHDGTLPGAISTCRYDPGTNTLLVIYTTTLDVADIAGTVFGLYDTAAAAKGHLEGRVIDNREFRSGLPD